MSTEHRAQSTERERREEKRREEKRDVMSRTRSATVLNEEVCSLQKIGDPLCRRCPQWFFKVCRHCATGCVKGDNTTQHNTTQHNTGLQTRRERERELTNKQANERINSREPTFSLCHRREGWMARGLEAVEPILDASLRASLSRPAVGFICSR